MVTYISMVIFLIGIDVASHAWYQVKTRRRHIWVLACPLVREWEIMCLNTTWFYRDMQEWAQQSPEVEENRLWVEENP